MKKRLVLFLAILPVLSFAQSKTENSVANAVEELRKLMIDPNADGLGSIVMEELSYGHSGGHIDTKKEFIEKLMTGKSDFVTIQLTDQTIAINKKTAIVRHKLDATSNDGGKPGEVHLLVMLVWQKQGGIWKLFARQAVKV